MFWSKEPTKADLQQHKRLKIYGHSYVIRKVNPLIDFKDGNVPQIFTSFVSRRKIEEKPPTESELNKRVEDMRSVVKAGLVSPELSKDGITIDDIFRDMDVAAKLYVAIIEHSLNRFRGLRGFFLSMRIKLLLLIASQKGTASGQATLPSAEMQA